MSIINSLPAYVDEQRDKLIAKASLNIPSASRMTLQTGVKTKSAILLVESDVVLQDGSGCGFSEAGETRITERVIEAPLIKVNMNFCAKDLLNKATQHDVRIAAGQENLPYEQSFIDSVMTSLREKKEKLLWQGDKTSTDALLKLSNGLLKTLKADVTNKITGAALTAANVIAEMDKVFMAIPAEIMDKAEIWVGTDVFRLYVKALQDKNLFHYAGEGADKFETLYPGTNVKIVAISGLVGTSTIVAGDPKNFYFGCDMEGDSEVFDLWYSKDERIFKLAIEFNQGANIAFPSEVVLRTTTA